MNGKTLLGLKQALESLRSAKLVDARPIVNSLEHSVYPHFNGARTGPLSFGGELFLNYKNQKAVYVNDGRGEFEVSLSGHSQKSFFDEVAKDFKETGVEIAPYKDKVSSSDKFEINPQEAADYADLQFRVFNAMARFKAHMLGPQTPIVIWPHGFDLSTIWFPFGVAKMDEKEDPQMNFGFSPGTPDAPEPYFYFYAWPMPDGLLDKKLPMGGVWNEVWSTPGAMFKLENFMRADNPDAAMTNILLSCYWEISPLLV